MLREISAEIARESVLEQMSRNMAEDKDKITLLSMAVTNSDRSTAKRQPQSSSKVVLSSLGTPSKKGDHSYDHISRKPPTAQY